MSLYGGSESETKLAAVVSYKVWSGFQTNMEKKCKHEQKHHTRVEELWVSSQKKHKFIDQIWTLYFNSSQSSSFFFFFLSQNPPLSSPQKDVKSPVVSQKTV